MSYNNPPGRFSSALSPGPQHYGSPAHGQHGSYPSSQPWGPQQHQQQPPEYGNVGLSGSPSGTPSPAHTPPASMSGGQFPGHRHSQASAWAQAQGMGMHAGGVASAQAPGYYRAPHPSLVGSSRAMQGPPQHAHMSSDRHSPGAWNNLGMPPTAKSPGAPATAGTPAGPGNPLFSLQMLVNQDINRSSAAQGNSYRTVPQQQESVDLSSASGEGYVRLLQQAGPIALTRADKAALDHSSVRNGSIVTASVTPPPTPLNGEVSSDGCAEPGAGPLSLAAKDASKETVVSVIAQTPLRERLKATTVATNIGQLTWTAGESSQAGVTEDGKAVVPEKQEASEVTKPWVPEEPGSIAVSSTLKQSDDSKDSVSACSPSAGSPVRSPKCGSVKRAKKVDSIVETLVESGAKKLAVNSESGEQCVLPVAASVIVSPAVVSEDSGEAASPGRDDVSPAFSDDADDKPRRKRKLDKPVRVSKTSSDCESEKPDEGVADGGSEKSSPKVELVEDVEEEASKEDVEVWEEKAVVKELVEEKVEAEKETEDKCDEDEEEEDEEEKEDDEADEEVVEERSLPTTAEPVSARGMDTVPRNLIPSEKLEVVRRRRSSESSTHPAHQGPPVNMQKTRRKSESDQQDDAAASLSLAPEQSRVSGESKFIEVETELEKMFAGIEEDTKMDTEEDPLKLDSGSPVLMAIVPEAKPLDVLVESNAVASDGKIQTVNLKRVRSRTPKRGSRRFSESLISSVSSADSTPQKKKRKQQKTPSDESFSSAHVKKRKQTRLFQGIGKEAVGGYDNSSNASVGRCRGPVVHVEGPRDNPYRVMVVNAPSRLDDDDAGDKKQASASRRKNTGLHNDLEYRGKVPRANAGGMGMFSSTLSARYDSQTADCSWICVFCKHGPHAGNLGLGDLFGPYLIGQERSEQAGPFVNCEGSTDDRDITEEQRRGGKNKRSLRGAQMLEQFQHRMSKKMKRSGQLVVEGAAAGLVPVSPVGSSGEECWEVWVHEECVVWAGGVYLVGSRIAGLQEAVWSAVRTVCNKCGQGGANVGCVRHGCEWRMHVVCARQHAWQLDQELYIARCHQHKMRAISPESILPT